jgi:hypothetical protein
MTAFSQPERRGLERMQTAAASHPDADLLAAFSEHSLTSREQEQVLAHLSVCQTCRDVVVLAGSQLVEPVSAPMRQRGLWEMPLFHWGAAAATAIVVVFAIAIGLRDYQPARKTAASATFDEVAPTPPAPAHQSADKLAAEPASKQAEGLVANVPAAESVPTTAAQNTMTTTRAKHLQEQFRYERPAEQTPARDDDATKDKDVSIAAGAIRGTSNQQLVQLVPPQSANQSNTISDQNAATAYKTYQGGIVAQKAMKQAPVGGPQNAPRSSTENAEVAGGTPAVEANAGEMTSESKSQRVLATHNGATWVRGIPWRINNKGQLQRGPSPQSFNTSIWEDVLPGQHFRAFAHFGSRILAGGDNGTLYLSADSGTSWTPISVHDGDTHVNGNITQLHFSDAQNGTLSTSAAETWTTADGGQTWHKQ